MEIVIWFWSTGAGPPRPTTTAPFARNLRYRLGAHAGAARCSEDGDRPAEIDHTVLGNAPRPARCHLRRGHVAFKAGVPKEVPALTVNRLCGSGIQSGHLRRPTIWRASPRLVSSVA